MQDNDFFSAKIYQKSSLQAEYAAPHAHFSPRKTLLAKTGWHKEAYGFAFACATEIVRKSFHIHKVCGSFFKRSLLEQSLAKLLFT